MRDRVFLWLGSAAVPVRLAAGAAAGLSVSLAAIVGLGASAGVGGLAGGAALFVGFYGVGIAIRAWGRAKLRAQAFVWQGPVTEADPISHFMVEPTRHVGLDKVPPYVPRNAASEIKTGLQSERLVVVGGERAAGKSRLIYETLLLQRVEVLVSNLASVKDGETDPLTAVLRDHRGLPRRKRRRVIVIRDYVSRMLAGQLTADILRSWLDRYPETAIIVTLGRPDLTRINDRGDEYTRELTRLRRQGRPVRVNRQLSERELKIAKQLFPNLSLRECEFLPAYLCSALPLQDRLAEAYQAENRMALAVIHAVANWQRAGVRHPATSRYIQKQVAKSVGRAKPNQISRAIAWACQPIFESNISLMRCEGDRCVVDQIVVEQIDVLEERELSADTWEAVLTELKQELRSDSDAYAAVLMDVCKAALERDNRLLAERVVTQVEELSPKFVDASHRLLDAPADPGSARALVQTRAGDSVLTRISEFRPAVPLERATGAPGHFIAWIYERTALRSIARVLTLAAMDIVSVIAAVSCGLVIREWIDGPEQSTALQAVPHFLALWIAITIISFGRVGLYRRDSRRARLSSIVIVGLILGTVGLVGAFTVRGGLGALAGAASGALVGIFLDYTLRARYDAISSKWVVNHGLEARTLLIGNDVEVAKVVDNLKSLSRPTVIVGYLGVNSGKASMRDIRHLGPVDLDTLAAIVRRDGVGRVVISDSNLDPSDRQELANACHGCGLMVEAVASMTDIRAGSAEYVPGQSLVLMRLQPLWLGSARFTIKRLFDLIVATLGLVPLGVVALPVVIAALLERDRILVRAVRYGAGEVPFKMHRFRTTAPGDPRDPNDGLSPSERYSRLGDFMRRRGLDELPQILNVLAGQMSIVGPRPLHPSNHRELEPQQHLRYLVKPGMTGPWLIGVRTALAHNELTALDAAYLFHWSIIVDFEILAKTLRIILRGRTAFPQVTQSG